MTHARNGNLSARALVHRDDELGEIAGNFNQMMDDIASRSREREELLRQIGNLNNALVKKVHLATTELRAANGNLIRTQQRLSHAERMAAIGQVTASLAHEIGTPLNAIAGHLQLLARNHPGSGDTQRRLNIINAQLASIVQTVKSLLERTHRRPIDPQPTDINRIVEELLLLVAPIFESHNIRVSQQLDEGLPPALADRESLHQVFLNLVNNSLEAMPEGGAMKFVTSYLAGGSANRSAADRHGHRHLRRGEKSFVRADVDHQTIRQRPGSRYCPRDHSRTWRPDRLRFRS